MMNDYRFRIGLLEKENSELKQALEKVGVYFHCGGFIGPDEFENMLREIKDINNK